MTSTTATTTVSREQAINQIILSVAAEEFALANLINAEAAKIQSVLGVLPGQASVKNPTIDDLERIDNSVDKILRDIIKKEMLLQFKLENALSATNTVTTTSTTTTKTSTTKAG